ncbi:MAG: calcium-binding protein [Leptolyngbyaceae cyanobacterium]
MTNQTVPNNQVQTEGIELLGLGESLQVNGVLKTAGEIPGVLTQGVNNAIQVRGAIQSEETAIRVEGVNTLIDNRGFISGDFNGIDVANGDSAFAQIANQRQGVITSESRAVNIGGIGAVLRNWGTITTTAAPRNGTIYGDVTARNIFIENYGVVDVGEGNNGDAISLELGAEVDGLVYNSGLIQGRGEALGNNQAAAVRLYWVPSAGSPTSTFNGDILNEGKLAAESGPAVVIESNTILNGNIVNEGLIENLNPDNGVGIRVEDGGTVTGTLVNRGRIVGDRTAIDIANGGTAIANIHNFGLISSDSRAVNLGGDTTTLINHGRILSTDDPRNGTVYGDVTARNIFIENNGLIDVGRGNNGDAIALELGAEVNGSIVNTGRVRGRGEAQEGNREAAAIRLYWVEAAGAPVSIFNGDIVNAGTLQADTGAAVIIDDQVVLNGAIVNNGLIRGGQVQGTRTRLAIDAEGAASPITLVNTGHINGDVQLSDNNDVYVGIEGRVNGTVFGNGGNDQLLGGEARDRIAGGSGDDVIRTEGGNDILSGGSGNDFLDAGAGNDRIFGGSGINFVIAGEGRDRITLSDAGFTVLFDFTSGEDTLALDGLKPSDLQIESIFDSTVITAKTTGEAIAFLPFVAADDLGRFRTGSDDPLAEVSQSSTGNEASVTAMGDPILGDEESNVLNGTPDTETIEGLSGNDIISSLGGNDQVISGTDNDIIHGGNGNDTLLGGEGQDVINGDAGDDLINGGAGNDALFGGDGADTFIITPALGVDLIFDFEVGVDSLAFEDGLSLGQVSFTQSDNNTLVIADTGAPLAGLVNVQANELAAALAN